MRRPTIYGPDGFAKSNPYWSSDRNHLGLVLRTEQDHGLPARHGTDSRSGRDDSR